MIQYHLRPYQTADFEFVYQTKKEAYRPYVEKFWGSWIEEKQRTLFTDFIKKVQDSLQIIEYENKPIGMYHGCLLCQHRYEVGNIILIPQYQGKGIGKDILLNVFKKYPASTICLRVFLGNPAIGFYQKLGFTVVDETKTHYIMERK